METSKVTMLTWCNVYPHDNFFVHRRLLQLTVFCVFKHKLHYNLKYKHHAQTSLTNITKGIQDF